MFDIITKHEFWKWQDAGLVDSSRIDLKGVQDAYVLSRLSGVRGRRILEVGGGNSRVLTTLTEDGLDNECWNADRFEGFGGGPRRSTNAERIRVAFCFLGEFSEELPDEYFDYIISVSVVEHVPTDELGAFMADSARVLRPGGQILHAIDLYIFDEDSEHEYRNSMRERLRSYLSFADRPDLRLKFTTEPVVSSDVHFRCAYASNSDLAMNQWNRSVPALRHVRDAAQSVSLKAEWTKY